MHSMHITDNMREQVGTEIRTDSESETLEGLKSIRYRYDQYGVSLYYLDVICMKLKFTTGSEKVG